MPMWIFGFVAWAGRLRSERRLHCRFPDVERAVARLAPRPWLMIHGEKDAYIGPAIARRLFAEAQRAEGTAGSCPKAKHNRCRELQPEAYAERIAAFFRRFAPRGRSRPTSGPPRDAAPRRRSRNPRPPWPGGLAASATGVLRRREPPESARAAHAAVRD